MCAKHIRILCLSLVRSCPSSRNIKRDLRIYIHVSRDLCIYIHVKRDLSSRALAPFLEERTREHILMLCFSLVLSRPFSRNVNGDLRI